MKTIAVIEDDRLLSEALVLALTRAGYRAVQAFTFQEGRRLLDGELSLMILDIGLPGGEGTRLCALARERGRIPVIFLTARDEEADMLSAFDSGADDYLVKPFPLTVLLRHVEAVLRRACGGEELFTCGELSVSFARKEVCIADEPVRLTATEYRLLELLARNKSRVVTKRMMLEQVWDADGKFVEENTVNVTLNRLKKKIEPDPANPVYIRNVFGLGYTLGE